MTHLTLSADYLDYDLKDVDGDPFDRRQIPAEIESKIQQWNEEYQPIVRMGVEERSTSGIFDKIQQLDEQGLLLADRLRAVIPDIEKVEYYSEGRLRRLS